MLCTVPCAPLTALAPLAALTGAQAGSSKVSVTGPCKLPASITVRAAKRWSTKPGASSAPTPKGRGGAPSTAISAAPAPLAPATTPQSTKRGAATGALSKGLVWPSQRAKSAVPGKAGAGTAGTVASGAGSTSCDWRLTASVQASAEAKASNPKATLSWRRPLSSPHECMNPDSKEAKRIWPASSPKPGAASKRDKAGPPSQAGARVWGGQALTRQRRGLAGLTLLELMVVLAVLGMASAAVSLAFRDPNAGQVEQEALRLASLLEGARAQSRSMGLPVRWQVSGTGFAFEGLAPDPALPQTWKHSGMQAQVQGGEVLVLGPEPVIAPQSVVVFSRAVPAFRWRVATDGVRPFGVQPAPSEPEAR